VRVITLRIAADESYRAQAGWEHTLRQTVRTVSDIYERQFQIRLEIGDIVPWTSGQDGFDPRRALDRLISQVPNGADVLVGFSYKKCVQLKRGLGLSFGDTAFVMTGCPRTPWSVEAADAILSHELGHLLGAFHVPAGTRSVMAVAGGAADDFDSQTTRVIQLMRLRDFRQGVAGIDAEMRKHWRSIYAEGHAEREANPLATALRNAGLDHERRGALDAASASYREALDVDPSLARPHADLGRILAAQGRLDDAAKDLRRSIELDSLTPGAYSDLGLVLARMGRADEAIEALREALRIEPVDLRSRLLLAHLLAEQGKADQAISEARFAARTHPQVAEAHLHLGLLLTHGGQTDQAVAALRQASSLAPGHAGARVALVRTFYLGGRYRDAWTEVERARSAGQSIPAHLLRDLAARMPEPGK